MWTAQLRRTGRDWAIFVGPTAPPRSATARTWRSSELPACVIRKSRSRAAARSVAAAGFLIFARGRLFLDRHALALAHFLAPAAVGVGHAIALGDALAVLDLVVPALSASPGWSPGRLARARQSRQPRPAAIPPSTAAVFEIRFITLLLSVTLYHSQGERDAYDETLPIRAEVDADGGSLMASAVEPRGLALARFEAAVGLVDDIGPAAAADHAAIAVARLQRLQAVANLHGARLPLRLVSQK